ncbi:MAG: urea ABC transporter ATP-binding subunit UrtE [Pseudomonadota bacterium]
MLSITGLNQYYSGSHILRDVSLALEAGKITGLLGRNGVGKTTLLNCILGLIPCDSGSMRFGEQSIAQLPPEARAAAGIALVPQGRMIFPRLTVTENLKVAFATQARHRRSIPDIVYELFPVLKDMSGRLGGDLSGGQQQQLAIGRALVQAPRLLLLDEPCEGIQPSIVEEIGQCIQRLNREFGMTVLLVEQRVGFVRRTADAFSIMERGAICAEGDIGELSEDLVNHYLRV